MTAHRYQPSSPVLAVDPRAFGMVFSADGPAENSANGAAAIVTIRGPLSHRRGWWGDSYEAILDRINDACEQNAPAVLLAIDSPGGDVAGLLDAARTIRERCAAAGKALIAHVDGQACSAAYVLAAAADRIYASRTAEVGSIGVIAARVDESRALEAAGLKVSLITSGARKADGWPVAPMGDAEHEALQADIDGLAAELFAAVAERRHTTPERIASLQAATYRGPAARRAGLIDEIGTIEHALASLSAAPTTGVTMDKEQEARDALTALAEDEECTDEERARARRALAALDESDDDKAEDGDDKPEAEDEDESEPEPNKDDDDDKATAAAGAVSASTAGALAAHGADVERRLAKLEARETATERKRLIAAHGAVPEGLAKILATKPVAEVKAILAELPRPRRPKLGDAAATAVAAGTRGTAQGQASQLPPDEARAMRRAMGLDKQQFGIVQRGNALLLGAPEGEEVL